VYNEKKKGMKCMKEIGERIRLLRKEQGLTQSQLVGTELTKSMLSQIENGKAMPSMKSLHYIAEQLGYDVNFLLEDYEHYAQLVHEMQKLLQQKKYEEVYERLLSVVEDNLPQTIQGAKLAEQFAKACVEIKIGEVKGAVEKAVALYEQHYMYHESAKAQFIMQHVYLQNGDCDGGIQLIRDIHNYCKKREIEEDIIFKLDLYYMDAIFLLGISEYSGAKEALVRAIQYSKENGVYYQAGEFYRMMAVNAIINHDKEDFYHFSKKANEYAVFTENPNLQAILEIGYIEFYMEVENDDELARKHLEKYFDMEEKVDFLYKRLFGKLLYRQQKYEEALDMLQVDTEWNAYHPIDKAVVLSAGAYRALCYEKLGNMDKAKEEIIEAYTKIMELPSNYTKNFVIDTYFTIMNKSENDGKVL
jgi:transcriptional regulator with XRE-family HTH domain